MADKGFTIRDELAAVGGRLVLPHFLSGKRKSITSKLPVSGFMWSDIWKD